MIALRAERGTKKGVERLEDLKTLWDRFALNRPEPLKHGRSKSS